MYSDDFIIKIAKEKENAFYLFDGVLFDRNLNLFQGEFEKVYSNVQPAYSLKTNYMPEICHRVKAAGWHAEVVSGFEYEIACSAGFKGNDIIFNGPVKEEAELYRAFKDGAVVQFESFKEIEHAKTFLGQNPDAVIKCAVRCNFDLGGNYRSRFGFDAESGDAEQAFKDLFQLERCNPLGAHCHTLTNGRGLESFRLKTQKLIDFTNRVFSAHDSKPTFINIGGGFFGTMSERVKQQFNVEIPSFSDYAEVVGGLMKRQYPDESVTLMVEPGASVVANTMSFICTVHSVKKIDRKSIIVLTGSIYNVRPTLTSNQIAFRVIRNSEHQDYVENAIVGGYTCMESDIIHECYSGDIAVGDLLLFESTGAYNMVFKPPFIKGAPPVYLIGSENYPADISLLRVRETTNYLLTPYVLMNKND